MAGDEEIAGHEIAGIEVPNNPILPPTTDPADTCDAYAEIEYAGECVPDEDDIYPGFADAFAIDGDTCDAYAEVEYAGECVSDTAVFPNLPTSNVEDFDTSTGRLGCGTPTVFITARCSSSMTCQLDSKDILGLTWTRRMDDVSEAEVVVGLTGDSSQSCCQCLAIVEPYCHELHIWRDGEEVWVGPIEAIRYEREQVTIKARDSLAWLDVRIPANNVDFETKFTGTITDNPLTAVATTINSAGFAALGVVTASSPMTHVVLNPSSPTLREVVQVVTHVAAATSITVVRARQGTVALAASVGTAWSSGGSGPTSDLTYVANYIIREAFADDVFYGYTCEISNLYQTLSGTSYPQFYEKFNETFLEILVEVAGPPGFNFTVIGRTIVLSGDTAALTPLVLLNDEHIMGEIEVTKDGKQVVNRQWVHWDVDGGIPGFGAKDNASRYCYHLIERIMDSPYRSSTSANDFGQSIVDVNYIAPRVIEIPAGSRLSPDTPWTINQMVPGARVDVAITRLCLSLTQSFRLIGITVEYNQADGELVGIELAPINNVAEGF